MFKTLEPVGGPFNSRQAELEQRLRSFEHAWRQGSRPSIEDFLPQDPESRSSLLIELIHSDLECALKAGESVRVESYFQRFPELASDPELAVDLIAAEWKHRQHSDDMLALAEFEMRFPQFAARLAEVLQPADPDKISAPPQPAPDELPTVSQPPALSAVASQADPVREVRTNVVGADGAGVGFPGVPSSYEVLQVLGKGGMGVVYLARQKALKRLVALKMILPGRHAGDAELTRFRLEAEAIARLQHPNIVQIHEIGEQEGQPYFSLEYVQGGSLDKKLAHLPQPPREAAQLTAIIARAMQAAHQAGVIHRDLKPANILITHDGTPKITDFGLAKKLDDDSGQTHSGAIMGTPAYMSP